MEAASTNTETLSISGDESVNFAAYSSAVHKVVVMVNAGILGLLQLMNQQHSSVLETHKAMFVCFYVFVLFYAFLRIREAIHVPLRHVFNARLVGHTSHLFGGLAALVLVYVVCAPFALALLLLWFLWISLVAYDTFNVYMAYSEANKSGSGSGSSQPSSPV